MTSVAVLVPRRAGKPERDATWKWVRAWWEREFPDWPVTEGHHNRGLFNRSDAVNTAAVLAGDWDVAVIIDADMICDPARIREAVGIADATGGMTMPFSTRRDLTRDMSQKIMRGYRGNWSAGVHISHYLMCSGIVVVPRRLWDEVGGFDPVFQGWGWEDNAFAAACETFSGRQLQKIPGDAWHFFHDTATDTPMSRFRNQGIAELYIAAKGDKEATRAVRRGVPQILGHQRIPKTLHRVVPERVDQRAERWWAQLEKLHPNWAMVTWRDPLRPEDFPLTSSKWQHAENGAQLADMVRLEVVLRNGGIYVDEDVEPFRSMEPLIQVSAFAAWEDARTVPNAVFGAIPWHPAIQSALDLCLSRIPGPTWDAGPGVFTDLFPKRSDVLLLPSEAFYPVHYRDPERELKMDNFDPGKHPATFVLHRYAGSWLKP